MATRNRRFQDSHFSRHEGVPGFIYVARNEFHDKDLYKVGYTSKESAQFRINTLNQGLKKGGAGALGFLSLVYERKTLNSYGAEQIAHSALKNYRVTHAREYFRAPIHDIMAAVDMAVKTADEAKQNEQADREAEALRQEAAEDRRKQAVEQERRSHAEKERQRHEEERWKLEQIRKEREEQDRQSALPPVDMTCPECAVMLTIPGSAAVAHPNQRLRCKNCLTVFLVNGTIVARSAPSNAPSDFKPQGTKTDAGSIKSQTATNVAVGLLGALLIAAYFINQPSQLVQPSPSTTPSKQTPKAFDPPSPTPQTVEAVAAQAHVDYPYLSTSAGDNATKLIVTERDRRISQGVSPPVALKEAVEQIAPKHDPRRHGKSARQ